MTKPTPGAMWRQCEMHRDDGAVLVTWIEERYTLPDRRMRLEGEAGWWTVSTVGQFRATTEQVEGFKRAARDFKSGGSLANV